MEQFFEAFMHHWFWGSDKAIVLTTLFGGILISAISYYLSVVFDNEWFYGAPVCFFALCLTGARFIVTYCEDFVRREPYFTNGLAETAACAFVSNIVVTGIIVVFFKRLKLISNDPYWFL